MFNFDPSDRERDEGDSPELISVECDLDSHDLCRLEDCICDCHEEDA